jgi:hypothetical protein
MQKPDPIEYPPYYHQYIKRVPDGDIIVILEEQLASMLHFLNSFSEEVAMYRYAPDKWCIKEVIGHVIDTERVFTYRALCFARNDTAHLPGFEQDNYVKESSFGTRSMIEIIDEYQTVRQASISLFRSLDATVLNRTGQASDYSISVRSIPYIVAGHELHHRATIETLYLHRKSQNE